MNKMLVQMLLAGALPLIVASSGAHAASMIRVACTDDAAGAVVSVNGVVKGECPFDTQVKAGRVVVRAVRTVNAETERVFESSFSIGDDVIKRVDVVLGQPQLSAEGVRLQALRRQQQEAEAARQRQAQLEREQQRRQAVLAALEPLAKQGAVPDNGKAFRDCDDCPAMVLVPSIQPGGEPLAVGQFEITRGQFAQFVRETARQIPSGCTVWDRLNMFRGDWKPNPQRSWDSPGFEQSDEHPVVCVSWLDARDYTLWLSRKTGQSYRLPRLQDYQYIGLVRQVSSFSDYIGFPISWKQDSEACEHANLLDKTGQSNNPGGLGNEYPCDDRYAQTAPVGSFRAGSAGLHDLNGNAAEWLDEPADVRESVGHSVNEFRRVRGISWADTLSPYGWTHSEARSRTTRIGFRLVRDLNVEKTP